MIKKLAQFLILILLAFAPLSAFSQNLIDGSNIDEIVVTARQFGSATLSYQVDRNPKIIGKIDNIPYSIRFRNCSTQFICEDMNFRVGFLIKPTNETINKWNQTKRFSRAYLDNEGDAILEMDIILQGGISEANLSETFSYWRLSLAGFTSHIGFK